MKNVISYTIPQYTCQKDLAGKKKKKKKRIANY